METHLWQRKHLCNIVSHVVSRCVLTWSLFIIAIFKRSQFYLGRGIALLFLYPPPPLELLSMIDPGQKIRENPLSIFIIKIAWTWSRRIKGKGNAHKVLRLN